MTEDECGCPIEDGEPFIGDWTWPGFGVRLVVLAKDLIESVADFCEGVANDLVGVANRQIEAKTNFREAGKELERITEES